MTPTPTASSPASAMTMPAPLNVQVRLSVSATDRSPTSCVASQGPAAITAISTMRTAVWTNAKVRPRISSSTSPPSSVMPVTQAIPAKKPSARTATTDRTMSADRPIRTRTAPAAPIEAPNSRRRLTSRSVRGPCQTPSAMPTKTEPNSSPYPGAPAPRPAA